MMRVIFFDFDGVLTPTTHGIELARLLGKQDQVQKLFSSFARSKTGVEWAVYKGISFFEGIEERKVCDISHSLPVTRNAQLAISELKSAGYHPIILTSGIEEVALEFAKSIGIEEAHGNSLESRGGILTGRFSRHPLLTIKSKGRFVRDYLKRHAIEKSDAVAVGNDENDWAMFAECGFSILFNPSTRLLEKINKSITMAEAGKKRDFYDVLKHISVVIRENDLSLIIPFLVPTISMFPEKVKITKSRFI